MKNPVYNNLNNEYYSYVNKAIIDMFPKGVSSVFDIGCGSGALGKRLLEMGAAQEIHGVELFEPAAQEARKYYRSIEVGDIESIDPPYSHAYFDLIIYGDILEHLKNPLAVLKMHQKWLKDNGRILICVPNIRYWKIAYRLIIKGEFEYDDQGIMDHTHLRFFTNRSFKRLLDRAGLEVEEETMRLVVGPKQQLLNKMTLGLLKEFLSIQMVYRARKIPPKL